eukprot:4127957-Alexandrium_andersonii.AAC.1
MKEGWAGLHHAQMPHATTPTSRTTSGPPGAKKIFHRRGASATWAKSKARGPTHSRRGACDIAFA